MAQTGVLLSYIGVLMAAAILTISSGRMLASEGDRYDGAMLMQHSAGSALPSEILHHQSERALLDFPCPEGDNTCFTADGSTQFCCISPRSCPSVPPLTLEAAGCVDISGSGVLMPGEASSGAGGPSLLYVWAGARLGVFNDFLAVFGLDPSLSSYGKLLCTVSVDTSGNEAHHMAISADRSTLLAGGLLSLLKGQNDMFFFDLSVNATCPTYTASFVAPDIAVADAFIGLQGGGFVGTMMGAANGGTPGGVVRFTGTSPDSFVGSFPQNSSGTFVGAEGLNPHGIDVREDLDMMLTTDYIEPSSTLVAGPTGGVVIGRTTVRVWTLSTMRLVKTINVTKLTGRTSNGGYSGFMDVKFIPGNPDGLAFANGGGVLYVIDPAAGTAEPSFVFDSAEVGPCIQAISSDGTRLYASLHKLSQVYMFDSTNPAELVMLDVLDLHPDAGPHFLVLLREPREDRLVVANYFLQEPVGVGVVFLPANYQVNVINIDLEMGTLALDPSFAVDFSNLGNGIGPANPHGLAYF